MTITGLYVVTQVSHDIARGTTVDTFGPFDSYETAERYRRQLLARNVDRFAHPPQRPTVTATPLAEATPVWSAS